MPREWQIKMEWRMYSEEWGRKWFSSLRTHTTVGALASHILIGFLGAGKILIHSQVSASAVIFWWIFSRISREFLEKFVILKGLNRFWDIENDSIMKCFRRDGLTVRWRNAFSVSDNQPETRCLPSESKNTENGIFQEIFFHLPRAPFKFFSRSGFSHHV